MNTYLLYQDTDRLPGEAYFDAGSIHQDLGLRYLYLAAAKTVIFENGNVKCVSKEDPYIMDIMKRVMMIPLISREEILYRQEILRDVLACPEMIRSLYQISCRVLETWNRLGRDIRNKVNGNNPGDSITDIKVLSLLSDGVREVQEVLKAQGEKLTSRGWKALRKRLEQAFPEELEQHIRELLRNISFYAQGEEESEDSGRIVKPRIVLECGLEDGLKLSSVIVREVASSSQRYLRPGGTLHKLQELKNSRTPDSFSTIQETAVMEQTALLERRVVEYALHSMDGFFTDFGGFFDQLKLQSAFYLGALQLKVQMERFGLPVCFPKVTDQDCLRFQELKELVMCLEQRVEAVGNTCELDHKMLLIVTGANQGGKSTFLRSIGLAQVMMQSGLMVAAESYGSGIFPRLFTHFTRREDSEMNSGRLDEELGRMSQIVDHLGERSLLLLNESFATTTEKEGSAIAYDITRALGEAGVKILTVTHLLTYARRIYSEMEGQENTPVEFLCAERKENGKRTFHMIQHAPELTSFGLDLYEELVGSPDQDGT